MKFLPMKGTKMIFGESSERKKLEQQRRSEGRLPPGQSLTLKWPVLQYGDVPRADLRTWDFRIDGLVEKPVRLTWEEFNKLPQTEIQCDIHCVTRWSRFDNRFEGVLFTEVMKLVAPKPEARFAMVRGEHGFTANLPLDDLMKPATIFAFRHDGETLSAEHGYPLRLVVPHLYFWKSVKNKTATTCTAIRGKSKGLIQISRIGFSLSGFDFDVDVEKVKSRQAEARPTLAC
jgi:DMSO/TMAO reductase YedYZ molybdopterin-dependent catalytic subunit